MQKDLIYDLGVHNGSDTAYYLRRGFKVIGIDANPIMISEVSKEFASEIKNGQLILLNIGIAADQGEMTFWVCETVTEWSSFDRAMASREGAKHYPISVQCRTLADVINEFGMPYYCKIDIEGKDREAISSLLGLGSSPRYISAEMAKADGDIDIQNLIKLGYRKFKIINQASRAQANPNLASLEAMLPWPAPGILRRIDAKLRGASHDGDWRFPRGSSGRFAEETPGQWKTPEQALKIWRHLHNVASRFGTEELGDWYDIHATR